MSAEGNQVVPAAPRLHVPPEGPGTRLARCLCFAKKYGEVVKGSGADRGYDVPPPPYERWGGAAAWEHCVWSCEVAKEGGSRCAKLAGWLKEEWPPWKPQDPSKRAMDDWNNDVGRRIGLAGGDCKAGCDVMFDELMWLKPVYHVPGLPPPWRPPITGPDVPQIKMY